MIDDDGRRLFWVKGRTVCPDEMAARFKATADRIARGAQLVTAQIETVNHKISRFLATLPVAD